MPLFPLLPLLTPNHLRVTILQRGAYRFKKIELADPPTDYFNQIRQPVTPGKAIKVTFQLPAYNTDTVVYQLPTPDSFGPINGLLTFYTSTDYQNKTESVWLPTDYPNSLSQLTIRVRDLQDNNSVDALWKISGIPKNKLAPPPIKLSAIVDSRTVTASATEDESDDNIFTELHLSKPMSDDGWYWEYHPSSPFTPKIPGRPGDRFVESKIPDKLQSDVALDYRYRSIIDRVRVDGTLTHFQSDTQELSVSNIPVPTGRGTNYKNDKGIPFTTMEGLKGTVTTALGPGFGSGPFEKAARFSIHIDPTTLNAGMKKLLRRYDKKSPDRLDVYADLIVPNRKTHHPAYQLKTGIDIADGYLGAFNDYGWERTILNDEVTPKLSIRLKIVRRVADQSYPFHLVAPIVKTSPSLRLPSRDLE